MLRHRHLTKSSPASLDTEQDCLWRLQGNTATLWLEGWWVGQTSAIVAGLPLLLIWLVLMVGCGGTNPAQTAPAITYESFRALDGSDRGIVGSNVWVVKPDGSGNTALTSGSLEATFDVAWSPDGSRLAFASTRPLNGTTVLNPASNIWVMKSDGSGATPLTKLTANSASSGYPVWSPNGNKIAFLSIRALDGSNAVNTNLTSNVWIMNADGSGAMPLTKLTANSADCDIPVWSADSTKLAYHSRRALDGSDATNINLTGNIWIINSDGSGSAPLTKLTASTANSFWPNWSPDGTKVAYASARAFDDSDTANPTSNIWVMKADGSAAVPLTKLTSPNAFSVTPIWSPDGSKLAFRSARALDGSDAANANNTENLWVMKADGSAVIPLTKLTAQATVSVADIKFAPSWSSDGSKLTFAWPGALDGSNAVNANQSANIWVINADGSSAIPLTKLTTADSLAPKWRP